MDVPSRSGRASKADILTISASSTARELAILKLAKGEWHGFQGQTILITGANRGIGRALVEEALSRGAKRVYGGMRQSSVRANERVTPVILDVTNAAQIQDAVARTESLDILVNNAGVDLHDDLSDRAGIERHLAVNLFGTHAVTQAFLPLLARSQGVIVNVLSLSSLASVPFSPAYSISKAAALSLTQSLRALY